MLHICAPQLSANCLYHLFINPRLVVLENEIMGARARKSLKKTCRKTPSITSKIHKNLWRNPTQNHTPSLPEKPKPNICDDEESSIEADQLPHLPTLESHYRIPSNKGPNPRHESAGSPKHQKYHGLHSSCGL